MIRNVLVFIIIFLFSNTIKGAEPIVIHDLHQSINVKDMDQYIDSSMILSYDQFQNNKELFYSPPNELHGTRNRAFMYWLSFTLEVDHAIDEDLLLICRDNRISHMEIWINGKIQTKNPVGTNYLFSNRNVNHRSLVFRLPQERIVTVEARIRSDQSTFFSFSVMTENRFLGDSYFEERLIGSYYGIVILAILFSLFMLIKFRMRIYLTYPIFAFVSFIICFFLDGGGFQHIWGDYPKINIYLLLFIPLLLMFSLAFLVLSVLDAWGFKNKYFRMIFGSILISQLGYVSVFTVPEYFIHNIFYMLPFITMIYACILKYKSGSRSILAFTIGFVFVVLMNTIYMLQPFYSSEHSYHIIQFLPHFGVIALTLSMTYSQFLNFYHIRESTIKERKKSIHQLEQLNHIKDRINEEIEEKVTTQTEELERKNLVIYAQNAELLHANDKLKEQTDEIVNLNLQLNMENQELKINVQKITESRILQNTIPFNDFKKYFDSDNSCYTLLESLKWQNGFECLKCGNTKYGNGKGERARRCTKCGTNESATSNTIFHRMHFPILKGFYILFLVNKHGDSLVSKDLSEIVDLRLATCWKFSKKIKEKKIGVEKSGKLIESWLELI